MKRIVKEALTLLCITLVAGLCLSFVYELTKGPIANAELQAKAASYKAVMAEADEFGELSEEQDKLLEEMEAVNEVLTAKDKDGNVIGYVMSVTTNNGYAGEIIVALGVNAEFKVTGFAPLSHSESPGFGARMGDDDIKASFVGVASGAEFDGISGATITSNALRETVDTAIQTAKTLMEVQQ